jgi:hypothetical protein
MAPGALSPPSSLETNMPGPLPARRRVAALALVSLIPIVGCGRAQGAQRSGPPGTDSGGGARTAQRADSVPADPVSRALDRVDAARARLESADAAAASAMRDLDLALDDVSQLEGASRFHARWPANRFDGAFEETAEHARDDGRETAAWAGREAQRIATRAERRAAHQAAMSLRRVRTTCECPRDLDAKDWNDSDSDADAGDSDAP